MGRGTYCHELFMCVRCATLFSKEVLHSAHVNDVATSFEELALVFDSMIAVDDDDVAAVATSMN